MLNQPKRSFYTRNDNCGLNRLVVCRVVPLSARDEGYFQLWNTTLKYHSLGRKLCKQDGKTCLCHLKDGQLDMEDLANKIEKRQKICQSSSGISNVLGCINPVKELPSCPPKGAIWWWIPNRRPTWPLMFRIY